MNRRDLLKLAAGAPLLKWLTSMVALGSEITLTGTTAPVYDGHDILNILLHGMFAVHFVHDIGNDVHQVILYPPHVDGLSPHSYFATDLANPVQLKKLDPGSTHIPFNFEGAKTMPQFSDTENVVVRISPGAIRRDPSKPAHCKIILPMPHQVIPLKAKVSNVSGQPLFTPGKTGALRGVPTRVPLITVLRYDLGANGSGQNKVMKYHFFAEPELCPKDFHSSEALDALRQLYVGLTADNLAFNTCLGPANLGSIPESPGGEISSSDEISLVELLHPAQLPCTDPKPCGPKAAVAPRSQSSHESTDMVSPGGGLGIHPTACMSILFDPS